MTLAALSPLFIWWPLSLVVLALAVTVARRVSQAQADPLWMPPHPRLIPLPETRPGWTRLGVRADWPPPDRNDWARPFNWEPWMDAYDEGPFNPPLPWTRVA